MVEKEAEKEPTEIKKITLIFTFNNAKNLGITDDGKKILEVLLSDYNKPQLQICTGAEVIKDKKSKAYYTDVGLPQFLGFYESDVFDVYPEMELMINVGKDEKGNNIFARRLLKHTWLNQPSENTAYFAVDTADHQKFKVELKSTKEIDIDEIKLKPNYEKVKRWVDKQIKAKEIELKELSVEEVKVMDSKL